MKRNIVREQVKVFILLAVAFALLAFLSTRAGSKPLLILSLALLAASPFMASLIVLLRLKREGGGGLKGS
ncbi:hypothetical protein JCM10135_08950 [Stetteria hydrogenophila]